MKNNEMESIIKKDMEKFVHLKDRTNSISMKYVEQIFKLKSGMGHEFVNLLVELEILEEYKSGRWQITDSANDIINQHKLKSKNIIINKRNVSAKVRLYVWQRDKGKCVKCGTNKKLEYDHIIPHSKGGSCTERNIQLLCEMCNRKKHANIGD
jgi:hypothetical protein